MSIQEILKLPVSDRLQMVEQIWDSLETSELEITAAQKLELDQRIALDKEGEMKWYKWEDVKQKINALKNMSTKKFYSFSNYPLCEF